MSQSCSPERSSQHRTLLLTQVCPYPAQGGGALRVWQIINILHHQGDKLALFSLFKGEPPDSYPNFIEHWYHYDIANPQRTLINKLQQRLSRWRKDGYVYSDWLFSSPANQKLQQALEAFQPTRLICSEIWLYRYLPTLRQYCDRNSCTLILDSHNVEGDPRRFASTDKTSSAIEFEQTRRKLGQIQTLERQWLQQADQTWACSPIDVALLKQLYAPAQGNLSQNKLFVVPNGIDPDAYHPVKAGQCTPLAHLQPTEHNVLFLARFSYEPNAEAADILINTIYPALKAKYPQCRLLLVGIDPTRAMQQAAQADPNIVVTGTVPEVLSYLASASVMVVPLIHGSGTRLKLLEAFAAGCPVVSTNKGAEGLNVEDGQQLLIRDTPEDIVQAVIDLWQTPALANQLIERAYYHLQNHYAWEAVSDRIRQALSQA
jgi:polysaccharide biosynthesis protein PslH